MQPTFFCDYGSNILLGERVFFNFNCVVLDVCRVEIGDFTLLGPAVQIYTATHPMNAQLRRKQEFAKPIEIGSDVWIGGGAIVSAGTTIARQAVIGAGAKIGAGAEIGAGAFIGPSVKIGIGTQVKDGVSVLSDLPDGATIWPDGTVTPER